MATVMIPVQALDEHCANCQCMDLDKQEIFAGFDPGPISVQYSCRNMRMCQYIKNRIVHNERSEGGNENGK